jgi:adenine-specific DNA-methyltransferase
VSVILPDAKNDLLENYERTVPHITKYMGSKRGILDYVIECIDDVYDGGRLCDLFAGTSILSGALGQLIPMHSNDIQVYSSVLANTYLNGYISLENSTNILDQIEKQAITYTNDFNQYYPNLRFSYYDDMPIEEFVKVEKRQQSLINEDFTKISYHLFTKYYSGTYWSFDQCVTIDSLRRVADDYVGTPTYFLTLSSLIYAMSYCSQSTGHYAQYREANAESSKNDILTYRQRNILDYFRSKFLQLKDFNRPNKIEHKITSLDYRSCLDLIDPDSLIYADPPYAFVHYSRFYHALETLVKYDFPTVAHKGRYRTERHQSPFGHKKQVKEAFHSLFNMALEKRSNVILSYSNTGMITLPEIVAMARSNMGLRYDVSQREIHHTHSTMGRNDDKHKSVKEYLVIVKKR